MDLPTSAPARSARWSADGRFVVGRNDGKVARVWDAATAEPVTPILVHEGAVHWACVTPGNRLITASGPNVLRAWDLEPTALPADAIAEYAQLISGRRLGVSGVMLAIPAKQLSELGHSLRARHPELFSFGTARD